MKFTHRLVVSIVAFGLCVSSRGLLIAAAGAASQDPGASVKPTRVVLLVDSSSGMSAMLTHFRAGINAFLDNIPADTEVALISTGGQLRVRVPPTTDREKLKKEANRFASDSGANSLLDTLLESDQRFLKKAPDRVPVFVILTTDAANYTEPVLDDYNKFATDFRRRGGHAHGIVVSGKNMGLTSQIVSNLTQNTGGYYEVLAIANSVPERMKTIAARVVAGR